MIKHFTGQIVTLALHYDAVRIAKLFYAAWWYSDGCDDAHERCVNPSLRIILIHRVMQSAYERTP
jgi:hypothetical protein